MKWNFTNFSKTFQYFTTITTGFRNFAGLTNHVQETRWVSENMLCLMVGGVPRLYKEIRLVLEVAAFDGQIFYREIATIPLKLLRFHLGVCWWAKNPLKSLHVRISRADREASLENDLPQNCTKIQNCMKNVVHPIRSGVFYASTGFSATSESLRALACSKPRIGISKRKFLRYAKYAFLKDERKSCLKMLKICLLLSIELRRPSNFMIGERSCWEIEATVPVFRKADVWYVRRYLMSQKIHETACLCSKLYSLVQLYAFRVGLHRTGGPKSGRVSRQKKRQITCVNSIVLTAWFRNAFLLSPTLPEELNKKSSAYLARCS